MSNITLEELLEAGVHFGHKIHRWNPKMFPYIYNQINNIHIIDLRKSAILLKKAEKYLKSINDQNKTILFVGTKHQASTLIAENAKRCGAFYVNHRWLGGMLTNWSTLKERIAYLKDLEQQEADGTFNMLTKKEAVLRQKKLKKLRLNLNGIKNMETLPDVCIIIDQKREITAIKECRKLKIPIISILDTNCNPDLIDIPIPGNDDAVRSIKLILNYLTKNIQKESSFEK